MYQYGQLSSSSAEIHLVVEVLAQLSVLDNAAKVADKFNQLR